MLSSAAGDSELANCKVAPAHPYDLQWFGKLVSAETSVEQGKSCCPLERIKAGL